MGLFSSIGKTINKLLGGSSSAKKAQKYQLQQMAQQDVYNEKYAQNAHQWEVQDLQKAGLNPVLSAGGSSAGAIAGSATSTGSGPSSTNGNIGDVMGALGTLSNMMLNKSNSAKSQAETAQIVAGLDYIPREKEAAINNSLADTILKEQETRTSKETEKYTRERARGYSESTSESSSETKNKGWDGGIGPIKGGKNKGTTKSSARSHSRTW